MTSAAALAMTGGIPWQLLVVAGFLLLAGAGTRVAARRFADVR
jgi:LPXTG-motif cell wall-anchored protein